MTTQPEPPTTRAGRYVRQPTGYRAFIPNPLPPDPPVRYDDEIVDLLEKANHALGRLDAASDLLPNPDLFVGMYVRKEAVLSSQIEGTQASLTDVLAYEASAAARGPSPDVEEVVNYVDAMNYGLKRVAELPVSNRLLREIHQKLLAGVRGQEKSPGEFRTSQNWIGGTGAALDAAAFVPPPPREAMQALGDLETYIHAPTTLPVLLKTGLIHYQFETIHPFLDGNGRIGRLLITFLLCHEGLLRRPLLYISAYFKELREVYYAKLQAVRDQGLYEDWLKFFLTAVWQVSREAAGTIHDILSMREEHRAKVEKDVGRAIAAQTLLDYLFQSPFTNVSEAAKALRITYPTANNLMARFAHLGLVEETSGRDRNRVFVYKPYVDLLNRNIAVPEGPTVRR